jgi:hypothetical protein
MFDFEKDTKISESYVEPEARHFVLITENKNHYDVWLSEDTADKTRKEFGAHLVPKHAYKQPRRFAD